MVASHAVECLQLFVPLFHPIQSLSSFEAMGKSKKTAKAKAQAQDNALLLGQATTEVGMPRVNKLLFTLPL